VDELDDRLRRRERGQDVRTDGLLFDAVDELFRDRQRDVASSSATRTSRNTSATSDSESRPRFASRSKIAPKRSERASNTYPLAASTASIFWTASPTVLIFSASSSGMSIPNSGLERHDELDLIEGIRAEVVRDRRLGRDLVLFDTELFDDDLLDAIESVSGHGAGESPVVESEATSGSRRPPPAFWPVT